ncbi:spermidine synthase [Inhella inkyongensis]|uniref:Spermidine synthase n=1 Tax=Inhella inkyongensis TaxID=392593 RepID=A0A840RXT7_9BURK|nr:fused MFS/spermidine synthase [Inhella inkyongensis]MBB5202745.1 spermidine synthase [Inhella inkyongensis]
MTERSHDDLDEPDTFEAAPGPALPVPYVVKTAASLSLHFSFAATQSRMDLRHPDRLTLAYTRTMMGFLLFSAQARRIAMIGLGGGSLVRFMLAHLPEVELKVVENNAEVLELRQTFLLPADDERFKVRLADGAEFVRDPPRHFDALLVDAFDGNGQPEALATRTFYQDCRDTLTDEGVLAVNLCPGFADFEPQLERLRQVFDEQVLVVTDVECSNAIAFATQGDLLAQFERHGWRWRDRLADAPRKQLMPALVGVSRTLQRFRTHSSSINT